MENKPEHHTETGFQNHPFIETAAPKGIAFYLRRFWGSIFTPDSPEGHLRATPVAHFQNLAPAFASPHFEAFRANLSICAERACA